MSVVAVIVAGPANAKGASALARTRPSIQTEKNARIVVDLACAPLAVIARVESSRLDFLILERQEWALGSVGELNRPYGGLVISGNQRNLHCDIELYFSGLSL